MTNKTLTTKKENALALLKTQLVDAGQEMDIAAGIGSNFKYIRLAGRRFSTNEGDTKIVLPSPLKCVVLKFNNISKKYYETAFDGKGGLAPDCCSADGKTPDAGVSKPQSELCTNCPKNVFGSKGKGKACSDSKRLVVMLFKDDDVSQTTDIYRLDVPPDSLKNLVPYSNTLRTNGYPSCAVITEISFDDEVDTPRLAFKVARVLKDEEIHSVANVLRMPLIDELLNQKFSASTEGAIEGTPVKEEEVKITNQPVDEVMEELDTMFSEEELK